LRFFDLYIKFTLFLRMDECFLFFDFNLLVLNLQNSEFHCIEVDDAYITQIRRILTHKQRLVKIVTTR